MPDTAARYNRPGLHTQRLELAQRVVRRSRHGRRDDTTART